MRAVLGKLIYLQLKKDLLVHFVTHFQVLVGTNLMICFYVQNASQVIASLKI
jgi:hypothetical protein